MRRFFVIFFAAAVGYISLSQEMLWMRAVSYMTGGRPSVFAHVLGFFLIGVAMGALFAEKLCEKWFDGENRSPVRFVGGMLIASAFFYHLSLAMTAQLMVWSRPLGMAAVYAVVAVLSFLLGAVFPVLCHHGARAGQAVGLAVSRLYLANIVGCTLGPLLTGFVLMQYLATDRIILLISLSSMLLGGAAFFFDPVRRSFWGPMAAVEGLAILLMLHGPLYDAFLEKIQFESYYYPGFHYKHIRENRSGVIAAYHDWSCGSDMLRGGGAYDGHFSVDPYLNPNGIDRAYMIAALHPKPESCLEIGLASGSWSRVIAAYEPVKKHTIVEINPDYLEVIKLYSPQKDLLTDPRVKMHVDDGRRWLNRNPNEKFDFILQNTTWHWRSHITDLLSVEYLDLCKRHLKPGGVMYYNTTHCDDVAYTAAKVFKHVVRYQYFVAASDTPFTLTKEQVAANLAKIRFDGKPAFDPANPAMAQLAEKLAGTDLRDIAPELRRREDLWLVTDDNMATEYKLAKWRDPNKSWAAFFRRRK